MHETVILINRKFSKFYLVKFLYFKERMNNKKKWQLKAFMTKI